MIELIRGRQFQLWEYSVSHGMLLIRSPKSSNQNTNIDVVFGGVEYISLPRFLREIEITSAQDEDVMCLRDVLEDEINTKDIYVIMSEGRRYYVVASGMKVSSNKLDIFDSKFS